MRKQFLEVGQIVSTHGVMGEVRLKPLCDSAELLTEFEELFLDKDGKQSIRVLNARVHKNIVIMKLEGVGDMNAAQKLRNRMLFADRDFFELEENTYFIQDLIGLQVVNADDPAIQYGILSDVSQTGANDVYHIKDDTGREVLIPAIADVVIQTDIDAGVMKIRPLKGLFDDED